ncbi:A/G-specific adenine glycosylase [Sphingorhabdus lutea]|nr:A/G-specific adenine glycosylase [Sphingorhabdus lutea]
MGEMPNPYHVWLSEIMLQQTTVATVLPRFAAFIQRWPDFNALAGAQDEEVMAEWAGLGYYARARNLIKCAKTIAENFDGQLPQSAEILLTLPGIGPYSAAAISAISFGHRQVIVDANVERVMSRLCAIETALPVSKPLIKAATEGMTPNDNSGDFAQAIMDLGTAICTAKSPKCNICPLEKYCEARAKNIAEKLPVKAAKKHKPQRKGRVFAIICDGHIWLEKRAEKGMLGGMMALPDDGWSKAADGDGVAPKQGDWQILNKQVRHVFTHFTLNIDIAILHLPLRQGDVRPLITDKGNWWQLKTLDKAGLPTLFSKAVEEIRRHLSS